MTCFLQDDDVQSKRGDEPEEEEEEEELEDVDVDNRTAAEDEDFDEQEHEDDFRRFLTEKGQNNADVFAFGPTNLLSQLSSSS